MAEREPDELETGETERVVALLPDPDHIGQSEYLAIYEVLESAEDKDHALAILDEFESWAKELGRQIRLSRKREDRTYERISVTLSTAGAAFDDAPATELGRIFRKLAESFEQDGGPESGSAILDINGNQAGYITLEIGIEVPRG